MDEFAKIMDNIKVLEKRKEGFGGQRLIVLPQGVIESLNQHELTNPLFLSHIGYFPNAANHFVNREAGAPAVVLIYCVDGTGWYETTVGRELVRPNQFLLIPEGMPHRYGAGELAPWSIYFLHFSGRLSAKMRGRIQQNDKEILGEIAPSSKRTALFEELYTVLEWGHEEASLEYASTLLWRLLGSFAFARHFTPEHSSAHNVIDASVALMKEQLENKISLAQLARQANLAPTYFSNLFKQQMGYSPIDYFNRLKIQHACRHLLLTDHRLKEISQQVGISDPYYFSRLFKKIMGESPRSYRKRVNR